MKAAQLTDRQIEILEALRDKSNDRNRELIGRTLSEALPASDIELVCHIINDEYLMRGINPDYSPNQYGRELETLLDAVNHPRLIKEP